MKRRREKSEALEEFRQSFFGRLRGKHGNIKVAAEAVGFDQASVSRWGMHEQGLPNIYELKKIADALGVRAGWLGYDEGDPVDMNEVERAMVEAFRAEPEDRQAAILTMLGVKAPALRPVVKSVTPLNRRDELERFSLKVGKGKQSVPGWLNLAAGKGGFLERCPEVWVIPKLAMARGIHTAIIRGDSMLETLQPGDVAILQELNNGQGTVLPAKESQDDKMPLQMWERQIPGNRIFALSLDGGQTLTIKRIRYQGKGADWYMLIEADNPAEFDARVVSSKDEVIVYAMLIGLGEK